MKFINMLKKFAPKNFLCRYPLTTGALAGAIVLMCVTMIFILALIAQVVLMGGCNDCSPYVWRNAYSFSISGVIYCVIMFALHGWAIWGIKQKKSSILLSWVVITAMWLSQTFFLLIILLIIHSSDVNIILWLFSFVLGLIAICVLIYFVLVAFSLWLELKSGQEGKRNIVIS